MLELIPKNWFSWEFEILKSGEHVATLFPAMLRESASVTVQGVECDFHREKMFSGKFVLEVGGKRLVEAQKVSALYGRFDVRIGDRSFLFRQTSWVGRNYVLENEGEVVGTVRPRGWISRAADVELPEEFPLAVQVFIAWLAVVMWKRSAAAAGG